MSNIFSLQGSTYQNLFAGQSNSLSSTTQGPSFGDMMGQVAGGGLALTPSVAQSLMYRSMTTGVPRAELEQYGGYSAVKAMFDSGGGSYSLNAIPAAQRQAFGQQIASTGVGNMSLVLNEHIALPPSIFDQMANNGINQDFIDQVNQEAQDGVTIGNQDSVNSLDVEVPLAPIIEKNLIPEHIARPLAGSKTISATEINVNVSEATQQNSAAPFIDSQSYIDTLMGLLSDKSTKS